MTQLTRQTHIKIIQIHCSLFKLSSLNITSYNSMILSLNLCLIITFNWIISTQYTQQYYHLFQTFNMPWRRGFNIPWRRGTARKSRGLPIQISRLIIITYSAIIDIYVSLVYCRKSLSSIDMSRLATYSSSART